MDDKTVPEPNAWADIADELERAADEIRTLLAGDPSEPAPCLFALNIQPYTPNRINRSRIEDRAATVSAVDAVSIALLGKKATTYQLGGGTFHHGTDGQRGPIEVRVYQQVADPALANPEQEIARLRAEVAELKAKQTDATGLAYTRADDEPDDPTPVSPARVPMHTGEHVSKVADDAEADDGEAGFAFGQDDDKPLHFLHVGAQFTFCGTNVMTLPRGEGYTSGESLATCPKCREQLA